MFELLVSPYDWAVRELFRFATQGLYKNHTVIVSKCPLPTHILTGNPVKLPHFSAEALCVALRLHALSWSNVVSGYGHVSPNLCLLLFRYYLKDRS